MSMAEIMTQTPWGYSALLENGKMPPVITLEQLHDATGGRFGPDTVGATTVLDGVSAAIRDACGWHVTPELEVEEATQGPGRVIALRTLLAASVESVAEGGRELGEGEYEFSGRGLIRRACFRSWPGAWGSVRVRYVSGIPAAMASSLAMVAAQVAANMLAAPAGVRTEQAGNVTISYNQTASGVSGGVRLLDTDLAMLAPYMIGEVLS